LGQYFVIANLDKKEFVNPHVLGCGLKLMEQVGVEFGTGSVLLLLLSSDSREAYPSKDPIVGSWCGDRIVVAGDYNYPHVYAGCCPLEEREELMSEENRFPLTEDDFFTDISLKIAKVIEEVLEGEFYGSGWRNFRYNEDSFMRRRIERV